MDEKQRKEFYAHLQEIGVPPAEIQNLTATVNQKLGMIDANTKARDKLREQIAALDGEILDNLFDTAALLFKRWEATNELSDVYSRLNMIGIYPPGKVEIPGGAIPGTPMQNLQQYLERFATMFTYATPKPEDTVAWFDRRHF